MKTMARLDATLRGMLSGDSLQITVLDGDTCEVVFAEGTTTMRARALSKDQWFTLWSSPEGFVYIQRDATDERPVRTLEPAGPQRLERIFGPGSLPERFNGVATVSTRRY